MIKHSEKQSVEDKKMEERRLELLRAREEERNKQKIREMELQAARAEEMAIIERERKELELKIQETQEKLKKSVVKEGKTPSKRKNIDDFIDDEEDEMNVESGDAFHPRIDKEIENDDTAKDFERTEALNRLREMKKKSKVSQ
jgi:hypothetical protein